jgi:hypothetical protein
MAKLTSPLHFCALLLSVSGQWNGWPVDGGSLYRTNFVSLPTLNLNTPMPHTVFQHGELPEDTVSMVEEFLIQSPLVTPDNRKFRREPTPARQKTRPEKTNPNPNPTP